MLLSSDIITIKNLDPSVIKMDEKSDENILIYCIEYVRIKDCKYVKINILNPLGAIQK